MVGEHELKVTECHKYVDPGTLCSLHFLGQAFANLTTGMQLPDSQYRLSINSKCVFLFPQF